MATHYGYGKRAYGALILETAINTPIKPTNYFYFDTDSLTTPFNSEVLNPSANTRSKNYFSAPSTNGAPTGNITLPIQSNVFGHFLKGLFGAPTSSTANGDGQYTHTFTSKAAGSIPTYTLDIGNTDLGYVRRFMGVRFGNLKLNQGKNIWHADIQIMAQSSFLSAHQAGSSATGAISLPLDTTQGITTADSVILGYATTNEETCAVTAVSSSAISVTTTKTHAANDVVVIATSTPTYSSATPYYQWVGGSTLQYGATLGTVAASSRFEMFDITVAQDMEARYGPLGVTDASRYPTFIGIKGYASSCNFKFHHQDMAFLEYLRLRSDVAVDVSSQGDLIAGTSYDTFQVQCPKIRIKPYGVSSGGDGIIDETVTADVINSLSDGFDIKVILKNTTASY